MMKFYLVKWRESKKKKLKYPCFTLTNNGWNDFGYVTLFRLDHHDKNGNITRIGAVKILELKKTTTSLPEEFTKLSSRFCSLGQDINFYKDLKNLGDKITGLALKGLNDVVFNPELGEKFSTEPGFTTSLLRSSAAEKAYKEASSILYDTIKPPSHFAFCFECQLEGAEKPHEIEFDFTSIEQNLPNRIIALVGKNGTGKTQILSRLASLLSGQNPDVGRFTPGRPAFDRVIAISYSAFDSFKRPESKGRFLYKYCGLRKGEALLTTDGLLEGIKDGMKSIRTQSRGEIWLDLLNKTFTPSILPIESAAFVNGKSKDIEFLKTLSSGQIIILSIMTEILSHIQNESLILFDEPELHLHPNAISSMLKCLNFILETFDSYSVLSTHSPIILQDVPSRSVCVLEREGNIPIVGTLALESFGENISSITNEIFRVTEEESTYKATLGKLAKDLSYSQVLDIFDGKLSLNARIFLKNLYEKDSPAALE